MGTDKKPSNKMEDREKKRASAKKSREYSIYSKKAVRAKEALIIKNSCVVKAKAVQTK
jgi:hypothetical protein